MRLLGLDPGLRQTGWGIIDAVDNRLTHVADGAVCTNAKHDLAKRLVELHDGILAIIREYQPEEAAVEETFVNKNPVSTLKLGQARAIALLVPAQEGLVVAEYPPNKVKKTVVGPGHAGKEQVQMMVKTLLPSAVISTPDAADALAVAICHAHYRETNKRWAAKEVMR